MFARNSTFFRSFRHLLGLTIGYTILTIPSVFAFKMGLIDGQVIMNTPEINVTDKQKQVLNTYYPKILELQKEHTSLESEFTKNEVLMDESTRREKQAKLMQVVKSINTLVQTVETKRLQIEQETAQKLSDLSAHIAKKHGLDVVLTTPTTGAYVSKKVDMTKEALKMLKHKPVSA